MEVDWVGPGLAMTMASSELQAAVCSTDSVECSIFAVGYHEPGDKGVSAPPVRLWLSRVRPRVPAAMEILHLRRCTMMGRGGM